MNRQIYLSIVLAIATALAVVLLAFLVAPVAEPFAWALIIGISTIPHYNRLATKMPQRPNLAAGIMVFILTILVILPLAALIILVAQNAAYWYEQAAQLAGEFRSSGAGVLRHFPFLGKLTDIGRKFDLDLSGQGAKLAAEASHYLLTAAADVARNVAHLLFVLAVALFMLFFIYRDGERLVSLAVLRFAGNKRRTFRFLSNIRSTVTVVTVGTLFTCLVQGITAGIGYFFADVPAPFLCGALTAVATLLPVIGAGFVWIPLVALLAYNGEYLTAGLLSLWCIFMVGLADNAIRPLAVGATSDIPVPAIVLGAICGVFTLGLLGVIVGPVVLSVLVTLWQEAVSSEPEQVEETEPPD